MPELKGMSSAQIYCHSRLIHHIQRNTILPFHAHHAIPVHSHHPHPYSYSHIHHQHVSHIFLPLSSSFHPQIMARTMLTVTKPVSKRVTAATTTDTTTAKRKATSSNKAVPIETDKDKPESPVQPSNHTNNSKTSVKLKTHAQTPAPSQSTSADIPTPPPPEPDDIPPSTQTLEDLTPMMRRWAELKRDYKQHILLFRCGDFYEMFHEDAQRASSILGIVLTKRNTTYKPPKDTPTNPDPNVDADDSNMNSINNTVQKKPGIPMCGVPAWSRDTYIKRLVSGGATCAIVEQLETVEEAQARVAKHKTNVRNGSKGTTKKFTGTMPAIPISTHTSGQLHRAVVRVVTPGTLIEDELLQAKKNNFLTSIVYNKENHSYTIAWVDISTGGLYMCNCGVNSLSQELSRIQPTEILISEHLYNEIHNPAHQCINNYYITVRPTNEYNENYTRIHLPSYVHTSTAMHVYQKVNTILQSYSVSELQCISALLYYVQYTHPNTQGGTNIENIDEANTTNTSTINGEITGTSGVPLPPVLSHIPRLSLPHRLYTEKILNIDSATRRSLELTETLVRGNDYSSSSTAGNNYYSSTPSIEAKQDSNKNNTLLAVMDHTITNAGARLLSSRLSAPLTDVHKINERLDIIEYFIQSAYQKLYIQDIRFILRQCMDIERCIQRISLYKSTPKDLRAICDTLKKCIDLSSLIETQHYTHGEPRNTEHNTFINTKSDNTNSHNNIQNGNNNIQNSTNRASRIPSLLQSHIQSLCNNSLIELQQLLESAIITDLPTNITVEGGGYIKDSYDEELKSLRHVHTQQKSLLLQLEQKYQEKTGNKKLSIKDNLMFGYVIEVKKTAVNSSDHSVDNEDVDTEKKPTNAKPKKSSSTTTNILAQYPEFTFVQQIKSAERYRTRELSDLQDRIYSAYEQSKTLEKTIYNNLIGKILQQSHSILQCAYSVADIDVCSSLALLAIHRNYTRPKILEWPRSNTLTENNRMEVETNENTPIHNNSTNTLIDTAPLVPVSTDYSNSCTFRIVNGRHPIVEYSFLQQRGISSDKQIDSISDNTSIENIPSQSDAKGTRFGGLDTGVVLEFTGNDCILEDIVHHSNILKAQNDNINAAMLHTNNNGRIWLLTGANMAGKSTFLRQNALIVIMAQMGSYVPAQHAEFSVVDKIFSRVGATDDIAREKSTFMMEMLETTAILQNATEKSLVICDEIGRGTSTYDGLAIAISTLEYLHNTNRSRTLFATHYHELCHLQQWFKHLKAYKLDVLHDPEDGSLIFMHKIVPGVVARSYGIDVAQMAGMPAPVISRAHQILQLLLEESDAHSVFQTIIRQVYSQKNINQNKEKPMISQQ